VQEIAEAEGLDLGGDEGDPRPKLQKLAKVRDRLQKESNLAMQRLLRDWGITSPPALEVARALNELLEAWASCSSRRLA
jgi:hypothetical protein